MPAHEDKVHDIGTVRSRVEFLRKNYDLLWLDDFAMTASVQSKNTIQIIIIIITIMQEFDQHAADDLGPFLTELFNRSLQHGVVPTKAFSLESWRSWFFEYYGLVPANNA